MVGRLAPLARLTFAPHSHCAASSSSSSTATPISDSSTAALDSSGGLAFETLIPSSSAVERERGGVRVVVGEAHADVWFNDARSLVDPFEHASLKRDDVSMLLNQSEQGIGEGESLGRALKWDGVHKEHMGRWSLYFLGANEQEGNAISQILHGLPLAPSLMGSSSCTSTVRSTTLLDTTTSLRRHATLRNSLALVDAATDEIVDVLQLEQGPSGGGGVPAVMARTDSQATSTSTGAETQVSDSTTLVDGLPPRPARVVAPPPTSSPSKLERLFADENAQPPAPPPKDVEHTGGMRQAERSTGAAEARQTILYDVHDSLLPTITAQAASAVRHPSPAITRPESLYAETISSFATAGTATATATPTGRRRTTVYATASEGIDDDERSNGNVSSAPTDQGGEGDESNQHGGGGGTARLEPVRTYDDGRYQSLSDIAAQHNMPGLGDAVLLDFLAPIEQQQLATSASRGGSRIAAGGGGAEGAMGPASTMTMRGGGSIRARRITREEIAERGLVPAEEDHQGGGEAQQQQHEGGGLWTKLKHSVVGAGSWTWHATLGGLFSYFFWSAAGAQGTERENEEDAAQTFRPSRAVLPRLTSALPLFSTATSSDGSAQHRSGLRVPRTAAGETTSRLSRVVYFDELGYMRDAFVEPWVLASSSGGWMR